MQDLNNSNLNSAKKNVNIHMVALGFKCCTLTWGTNMKDREQVQCSKIACHSIASPLHNVVSRQSNASFK